MSPKLKKYSVIALVVIVAFFVVNYAYHRVKNQEEMSNILAMAGISGAKVYTIEPNRDLVWEIELAKSNPEKIIDQLEKVLDAKMLEHGKERIQYSDQTSPAARKEFEASYAYAIRIILLKQWKPGMTRQEILKNYFQQTNLLKTQYDFKNHADEFLGFK